MERCIRIVLANGVAHVKSKTSAIRAESGISDMSIMHQQEAVHSPDIFYQGYFI
ncbi:MAG: hypothetical protein OEY61_12340 [Gammaproteobacteria bacterium]|nr:hypothetical protein [Gammaproteobacteria bacterium]